MKAKSKYKAGDILRAKSPGNRVARVVKRCGVLYATFADDFKAKPLQDWINSTAWGAESAKDCFDAYDALREAVEKTLEENRHLADGDDCTLIRLKRIVEK